MAASNTRLIVWVTALGMLILAAMSVAVFFLVEAKPPSLGAEARWLHVKVAGALPDAPGTEALLVDPADLPPLSTEMAQAIRDAATDPEVAGVFFEVESVSLGWARAQELRAAIAAVAEAGKPCVAWSGALTNSELYLATGCPTVQAPPAALVFVNGLSITQTYYRGLFDRYKISPNFEHVGDFKSAVEPYERTGPSEAAAQATDALLDSLYGQFIDGIAAGRSVDAEVARGWVDDPPMTAADAQARGMIDALKYRDEAFIEAMGEDPDPLPFRDYLRGRRAAWSAGEGVVAVLYAEGAIIDGSSAQDLFGSQYIGDRTLRRQLADLREDDDVKAVVLRVNSPGGSGQASDAIWREVARLKEEKPVVVSMADYAASGGYYISMGANRIYAEPGTLTGSIGVFGGKINLSAALAEFGVSTHTTRRGRYATLLSGMHDFDDAERAKFKAFLAGFYDVFVTKAAEGRGMTPEALHAVAQGRVWTGAQALEHGLVDELGGLDAAVAHAAELGGISGTPEIRRVPQRKGFLEQIMEDLSNPDPNAQAAAGALALVPGAQEAGAQLALLDAVMGTGGPVLLLPGAPWSLR